MNTMKDLYPILQQLGITYLKHDHAAFFTCEEADAFYDGIEGNMISCSTIRT